MKLPKILAPAGDKQSFLAALAAGADAVYCGLKIFSARMEAANFSMEELARLTRLARNHDTDVYLAFNSLIKEAEIDRVFSILCKLARFAEIKGLIIQDPALISMASQAGLETDFHLSTLGNCTAPSGFEAAKKIGFNTIVLPREFNLDEIKTAALNRPGDMDLELFIHGALCYSISGRCYWSSWFGGKSSLRGRCVQPCRRLYDQKNQKARFFSCTDFSADVLVKVLKEIPGITTWKIEGRKKSPHYVYYAVKAYRMLRDTPKLKNQALSFLDYAMGRQFSHYNLLSHRRINPLEHGSETGSGLFAGRIKNPDQPFFVTREALMPSDLLRIGHEDDAFHTIQKVSRAVPKNGKFYLARSGRKKIRKGTPVYLIDRRDSLLAEDLKNLELELERIPRINVQPVKQTFVRNRGTDRPHSGQQRRSKRDGTARKHQDQPFTMDVYRQSINKVPRSSQRGLWLSGRRYGIPYTRHDWLWIDPLIFPEEEPICLRAIEQAIKKGVHRFVLNALWQTALFTSVKNLSLWAGPFCNVTNSETVACLKSMGYSGVIVSPELDKQTFLTLPKSSSLPLGVVIHGNWPLGISRIISPDIRIGQPFSSPMGESAWVAKFNDNYHLFPNWQLDLTPKINDLKKAGYTLFVNMHETVPRSMSMKNRPGLWNWDLSLL